MFPNITLHAGTQDGMLAMFKPNGNANCDDLQTIEAAENAERDGRRQLWERQLGESTKAYSAFSKYRDLSKKRTLAKVAHRKDDGKREIGVVAEDVDKIVPEVVSRDPKTHEIQGVDYSRLAALLIGAVKAQQAEIRQLKAQIEQLTASQSGQ